MTEEERRRIEAAEEVARENAFREALVEFCCPPLVEKDLQETSRPANWPPNAAWPPKVRTRTPSPALQRRRLMALMALVFVYPDTVKEARESELSPVEWVRSWGFLDSVGEPSSWITAAVLLDRHEAKLWPGGAAPLHWCVPGVSVSEDVDDAQRSGVVNVEQYAARDLRPIFTKAEFADERDGSVSWIAGPIQLPKGHPRVAAHPPARTRRVPQLPDADRRRQLSRKELELEVAAVAREYLLATKWWDETSEVAGLRGREAERVKTDLMFWANASVKGARRTPLDLDLLKDAADGPIHVTDRHRSRRVRRVAASLNLSPPRPRGRPRRAPKP